MTLPFEKSDERKYQCFVCGLEYPEFDAFTKHIIEKHEEGRDYIKCPLQRCGACVRDLKTHFKVKHKTEPLPKTGSFRAIVWKDVSKNGKLKTKKPMFRDGWMTSVKNHGKEFHYKSNFECEIFECLEAIPEVLAYDYEPFKGGIPYLFKGEQHHYHPDLSIKFNDGHIEIWEVKPASQTDLEVNRAKWTTAEKFCEARGWEFIVVTEVGLGKLKQRVRLLNALNEAEREQS